MVRRNIYDYFLLFVLLSAFYGIIKLLAPFAGSLVAALLCAVTFYPMYTTFERWFPRLNPTVRAIFADILVFIFFVTPLITLAWAISQESNSLLPVIRQGSSTMAELRQGNVIHTLPLIDHIRFFLTNAFGIKRAQFQETIISSVDRVLAYLSFTGSMLAAHAIRFLGDLLIMLFSLFFMFRDGDRLTRYLMALIPMRRATKDKLCVKVHNTVIGIVRGLLLTSLLQGIVAAIGYVIIGVNGAVLLGAITAVVGLLPLVGTFGVWGPTGVYFLLQGDYMRGGFILAWGAFVVVGLIDSVLRPYLVGKHSQMPLFALFFAFLGGVEIWGAKGIVLGPLLVSMVPALLDIYRERYLRQEDALETDLAHETEAAHEPAVSTVPVH